MVRYILSPHLLYFIAFLDVSQCNESLVVDGESEEAMFVLPHISWKPPTQGDLDFQVWGLINISAFYYPLPKLFPNRKVMAVLKAILC